MAYFHWFPIPPVVKFGLLKARKQEGARAVGSSRRSRGAAGLEQIGNRIRNQGNYSIKKRVSDSSVIPTSWGF